MNGNDKWYRGLQIVLILRRVQYSKSQWSSRLQPPLLSTVATDGDRKAVIPTLIKARIKLARNTSSTFS